MSSDEGDVPEQSTLESVLQYLPDVSGFVFNKNNYFFVGSLLVAVILGIIAITCIYLYITLPLEAKITKNNVEIIVDSITNDIVEYVGTDTIRANQKNIQENLTLSPDQIQKLSKADTEITNNNEALKTKLITTVIAISCIGALIVTVLFFFDPVKKEGKMVRYGKMVFEQVVLTLCMAGVYVLFQFLVPIAFVAADTHRVKTDAIVGCFEYTGISI